MIKDKEREEQKSMTHLTASNPEDQRKEMRRRVSGLTSRYLDGKITNIPVLDRMIMSSAKKLKKKAKTHFGFELRLSIDNMPLDAVYKVHDWIAQHSERAKKMIETGKNKKENQTRGWLTNTSFYFKVDKGTYCMIKIGEDYRDLIVSGGMEAVMMNNSTIKDSDMYIYIFGKKSLKYKRMIDAMIQERPDDTLRIYKVYGEPNRRTDVAFRSLFSDSDKRDLSTIFMEDGTIESITDHIDKYMANKDLYTGRGIIYKTGILLYGEPGTGKTSLIKALASKYGYDLATIDMATFDSIGLETFTHSINIDDRKYIIALEDIDCVIADRENSDIDKDEKKVVNKLLQFLDSNSSPNEVIFIASTNHIELLDEALLREGRFDLRVEITGVHEAKAREMCKSFNLSDTQIDEIINMIKEQGIDLKSKTIRQSKLQSIILQYSGMNLRGEVGEEDDNSNEIRTTESKNSN